MNRLLRHFKIVAEHKKISSACRELNISQPALSKSIKTLEDEFNLPLFERRARGMELTEAGERLLIRINRMEMEYQLAVEELDQLRSGNRTTLTIGSGPVWERYLSPVLTTLYDEYPNLEIIVRSDTIDQLIPDLLSGKLDIALGGDSNEIDTGDQLVFAPLLEVKMQIAAHYRHPLANLASVDNRQLAEYPWVAYQRSRGLFLNHLFQRKGIKPVRYSLQTELLDTALHMLKHRNALMCIAEPFFDKLTSTEIVKIELNESVWSFHSGVWYHSTARQIQVVNRFIDLLNERVSKH